MIPKIIKPRPEDLIWNKEVKWVESIEVNLRDYKVLQSRGLQNQPTEQHDTIVGLIKKNMNQIKRIRKAI